MGAEESWRRAARAVKCPTCGVAPGEYCRSVTKPGAPLLLGGYYHTARRAAASVTEGGRGE